MISSSASILPILFIIGVVNSIFGVVNSLFVFFFIGNVDVDVVVNFIVFVVIVVVAIVLVESSGNDGVFKRCPFDSFDVVLDVAFGMSMIGSIRVNGGVVEGDTDIAVVISETTGAAAISDASATTDSTDAGATMVAVRGPHSDVVSGSNTGVTSRFSFACEMTCKTDLLNGGVGVDFGGGTGGSGSGTS